jgi:hypothetical protein
MTHPHINPDRFHDSAGVPWEGRQLEANPHAGDDGSADANLLTTLAAFKAQTAGPEAVIEAIKTARLLVPLVAQVGETGVGAHGQIVDKSADLSIVSVASPDGQVALPVFSSVAAMQRWDAKARPVPIEAGRVALAAASEKNGRIILDPGSDTEFAIRQTAFRAIAENLSWHHPAQNRAVKAAFAAAIDAEPQIENYAIQNGDPTARLQGPEVLVFLKLVPGSADETALNALVARLGEAWAESPEIVRGVDSIAVKVI